MPNWSELILDLLDKNKGNMTQQEIADVVDCSQNYVSDLKTGKRGKKLSYLIAESLKKLHAEKKEIWSLESLCPKN